MVLSGPTNITNWLLILKNFNPALHKPAFQGSTITIGKLGSLPNVLNCGDGV